MAAVQKGPIVPLGNPRVIGVIMLIAFVFLSFAAKAKCVGSVGR